MFACSSTERTKFVQLFPANLYVPGFAVVRAMNSDIFRSCSAVVEITLHCSGCFVSGLMAPAVPVIALMPADSLRG
jgi:hypothetical protein